MIKESQEGVSDNEGYLDKESNSFDNILTYGNITVKPTQI